jgi:hypothetical protein
MLLFRRLVDGANGIIAQNPKGCKVRIAAVGELLPRKRPTAAWSGPWNDVAIE